MNTHTHTHTHTHIKREIFILMHVQNTYSHAQRSTKTHTLPENLFLSLSALSLTLPHSGRHIVYLVHSHRPTHTHTRACIHTHTHTPPHTQTHTNTTHTPHNNQH